MGSGTLTAQHTAAAALVAVVLLTTPLLAAAQASKEGAKQTPSAIALLSSSGSESEALAVVDATADVDFRKLPFPEVEQLVHRGWWNVSTKVVTRSHSARIDFTPAVRKATAEVKKRADLLLRWLDPAFAHPSPTPMAVRWAQNTTALMIAARFSPKWDGPGGANVAVFSSEKGRGHIDKERTAEAVQKMLRVNISANRIEADITAEAGNSRKRYHFDFPLFDEAVPERSHWTVEFRRAQGSMQMSTGALIPELRFLVAKRWPGPRQWPRLTAMPIEEGGVEPVWWAEAPGLSEGDTALLRDSPAREATSLTCARSGEAFCSFSDSCVKMCVDECSKAPIRHSKVPRCIGKPEMGIAVEATFIDDDLEPGTVGGTLNFSHNISLQDAIERLEFHWGSSAKDAVPEPLAGVLAIASREVQADLVVSFEIAKGTPVPAMATHLLVMGSNEVGQAPAAFVSLVDRVYPPSPLGLHFEDVDPTRRNISGVAEVDRASDETHIEAYELYFGRPGKDGAIEAIDGTALAREDATVRCAVDSDACLQQTPHWDNSDSVWGSFHTCASSTPYCNTWQKDMHRCCSQSCGVSPVCDAKDCHALNGNGTCIYPNPATKETTQSSPVPGMPLRLELRESKKVPAKTTHLVVFSIGPGGVRSKPEAIRLQDACPPTVEPIELRVGKDSDPRFGSAGFTISLGKGSCKKPETKPTKNGAESPEVPVVNKCDEGTSAVVYFALSDGTKLGSPVADLPFSEFLNGHKLADMDVPSGATHVTALARNVHGEMLRGPMARFTDDKSETIAAWANMRVLATREDGISLLWRPFSPDNASQVLHEDFGHGSGIDALALDEQGYDAFAGRGDGKITCLDLGSNRVWRQVEGVSNVISLAANGQKMQALRGSGAGILDVWDLNEGGASKQLVGHTDDIMAITVDWAGNRAATASMDGHVIIWDLAKSSAIGNLSGHEAAVHAVAANWDKGLFLTGSQDETLRLWSLEGFRLVARLEGHSDGVRLVFAGWEQMRALSVSEEGTVKLWDLKSHECLSTFSQKDGSQVLAVYVDWKRMQAMAALDDKVELWDLKEPANNPLSVAHFGGTFKAATISPQQDDPSRQPRQWADR